MAALYTEISAEPDMALIAELLENISRHPPAVQAQKLLVEHYISVGWLDAAQDNVKELKKHAPRDPDINRWTKMLADRPKPLTTEPTIVTTARATKGDPPVKLPENLDSARDELSHGYKSVQKKAKSLLSDFFHLKHLEKIQGRPILKNTAKLKAIANGNLAGTNTESKAPGSARSVSKIIQENPEKAFDVTMDDLIEMMKWLRSPKGKAAGDDNDTVREGLVKRVRALESALPNTIKFYPELALMHIDHEHLGKTYVNDETMLGDTIAEIPRHNFWVTEDNYAWDMEELAQAITSNGGIMRNPLSRQMFTERDIRGIVAHPAGKELAALQVEQHELSKGIRPDTITRLETLGKALLADQSADSIPSRHAVDEFMAYCATLPQEEQKAIEKLRCPAKDSHTGQSYDFSIGEAVRDAKGNRVCFHKTGDFVKQAAAYLRQNRGAPPDPDKCVVM